MVGVVDPDRDSAAGFDLGVQVQVGGEASHPVGQPGGHRHDPGQHAFHAELAQGAIGLADCLVKPSRPVVDNDLGQK